MTAAKTKKLEALRAKVAEKQSAEREIHAAHAALQAEVERLRVELLDPRHDSPIDGSAPADPTTRKLVAEYAEKGSRVEDMSRWNLRLERAQIAVRRAESDLGRFIGDNAAELIAEIEPEADAAVEAIENAADALLEAFTLHANVGGRVAVLLRFTPGLDGRDVPSTPGDQIRQEIERMLQRGIPRPLPKSLYPVDGEEASEAVVGAPSLGIVGPAD